MASAAQNSKDSSPFITLSGRETVGWSLALFALFAWMFFLGVLVGRGSVEIALYPTELQQELMAGDSRQEVLRPREAPESAEAKVELSFYKETQQGEEGVTKHKQVTKEEKKVLTPKQVAASPAPVKASFVPEAAAAPKPKVTPAPLPAPVKTDAPPSSGYTIQVAAHTAKEAAEKEAVQLQKAGFSVYVVSATDKTGRTWHRVRVGHYDKKEAANQVMTRLSALKKRAYVVKL